MLLYRIIEIDDAEKIAFALKEMKEAIGNNENFYYLPVWITLAVWVKNNVLWRGKCVV